MDKETEEVREEETRELVFKGRVWRIDKDEGLAYVSLWDPKGREGYADIKIEDLATVGVGEDDDFTATVKFTDPPSITYALVPRRELSQEEVDEIWRKCQELADALRDDDFGDS